MHSMPDGNTAALNNYLDEIDRDEAKAELIEAEAQQLYNDEGERIDALLTVMAGDNESEVLIDAMLNGNDIEARKAKSKLDTLLWDELRRVAERYGDFQ